MESVPYFLPSNEEAKEIKAGNKSLIDRFYLQNLSYIRVCANAYCRRLRLKGVRPRYEIEDYVQESYLHFSEFSFDNIRYFARTLFCGFSLYNWDGLHKYMQLKGRYSVDEEEYILDVIMPNGKHTFGELIPSNDFVMLEPGFSISDKLYAYLSSFLTNKQSAVFDCVFWTGFTNVEIAEFLGKTLWSVEKLRCRMFEKFRKRQAEIRQFLDEIGYADSKGVPA